MGAKPIMELRKGDAAENIDGDFEAWEKDLFEKLKSMWLVCCNKNSTSYALPLSVHQLLLTPLPLTLLMACRK
jgi:singapore isolate B (sub-type 7) whole genome shotgun sequence assembly, scaffold_13